MALEILAITTILLAPVLAEFAKIRSKAARAFNFIAVSGVVFLLATGFSVFSGISYEVAVYGAMLFDVVGLIFLFVGALWTALILMKK